MTILVETEINTTWRNLKQPGPNVFSIEVIKIQLTPKLNLMDFSLNVVFAICLVAFGFL